MKKLYRSRENKVLAGVIGGLGEYFSVDPILLRLIWVVLTLISQVFPGVIVYLAGALIMPKRPANEQR